MSMLSKLISWIKEHDYYLGLSTIIGGFLALRLAYFFYVPIPEIGPDSFQYYQILDMIQNGNTTLIHYPSIGYPLFLGLVELFSEKLITVAFVQSFIQLLAVLYFFHSFAKLHHKYLLVVALLIVGYLGSNLNFVYDAWIVPDSLLSTLYIVLVTMFLKLSNKFSFLNLAVTSVLIAYTISVRANGIVFLPILFFYASLAIFKDRKYSKIPLYLGTILLPLLCLASFNYFSPMYQNFNIVGNQHEIVINQDSISYERTKDKTYQALCKLVDEGDYFNLNYHRGMLNDTSIAYFMNGHQRGVDLVVENDSTIIVLNRNETRYIWKELNLKEYCKDKGSEKQYDDFLSSFKTQHGSKTVKIWPELGWDERKILFVAFYKVFYKQDFLLDVAEENRLYFDKHLVNNFWRMLYNVQLPDDNPSLNQKVMKEFYHWRSEKYTVDSVLPLRTTMMWEMKSSRVYRYFMSPFFKVHPYLFRNELYPIILLLVTLLSTIGLFYSKFNSPVMLFASINSLLVLAHNFLFSIHFVFLLNRYTYEHSFMYYIAVMFLPLVLLEWWKLYKQSSLK